MGATTWTIYGLTDPRDGGVRYVGRTRLPLRSRLVGHISDKSNRRKAQWIAELLALGLRPGIVTLAATNKWPVAQRMEFEVIAEARRRGWMLTNSRFRVGSGSGAPPRKIPRMTPEEFRAAVGRLGPFEPPWRRQK